MAGWGKSLGESLYAIVGSYVYKIALFERVVNICPRKVSFLVFFSSNSELKLSRFTRFSWGKIWVECFAQCK